ncbi:hypothetical protein ROZALSC1DRAFT_25542 [Rozella allomycis CSF55]|uniref:J domain-containing protein n=1 Tax=Rozella allomycis (strain CSF55) TaxID=988480 RepID=A0A4P9YAZ4_ROZAC|nr:hypothetical protein ROZALSC1DRAFT_25542 [Rozella allomycis CSF55]
MKFHPDVLSQNRQLTNEQVQVRTEYFKLLNEALSNIESFIEEKEKERLIAQEKNRRDTRPPNFHDPWKSDEKPQSRPSAHFDDLNMEDPWKEARNPGRRGPYYPSQEEFDMASRISKMENVKEAYEYLKPMLESSNGVEELKRRLYRSMMLRSQGLDSVEALKVNVLFMHMEKAVDNVNHYLEEQNRKKMESLKKIPVSQYYRYGGLGLRKPLPMRYSAFHR